MYAIKLTGEQLGALRAIAEAHALNVGELLTRARTIGGEVAQREQAERFTIASGIVAGLAAANWIDDKATQPLSAHTYAERKAMQDAGLDPDKELGPIDPGARNPVCIHGKAFTEPCSLCDESNARNPVITA
jgi:hypothetical protein